MNNSIKYGSSQLRSSLHSRSLWGLDVGIAIKRSAYSIVVTRKKLRRAEASNVWLYGSMSCRQDRDSKNQWPSLLHLKYGSQQESKKESTSTDGDCREAFRCPGRVSSSSGEAGPPPKYVTWYTFRGTCPSTKTLSFNRSQGTWTSVHDAQIFKHVQPVDLLHISRSNKFFRAFLLKRRCKPIWIGARMEHEPDLPEPPAGMSEPAYTNLIWGTLCYVSGSIEPFDKHFQTLCYVMQSCGQEATQGDALSWYFKMRYCKNCIDTKSVQSFLSYIQSCNCLGAIFFSVEWSNVHTTYDPCFQKHKRDPWKKIPASWNSFRIA